MVQAAEGHHGAGKRLRKGARGPDVPWGRGRDEGLYRGEGRGAGHIRRSGGRRRTDGTYRYLRGASWHLRRLSESGGSASGVASGTAEGEQRGEGPGAEQRGPGQGPGARSCPTGPAHARTHPEGTDSGTFIGKPAVSAGIHLPYIFIDLTSVSE